MGADQKSLCRRGGNIPDVFLSDRDKPLAAEPFQLSLIMDYRPKGIQLLPGIRIQELLRLAYGPDDPAAKARTFVYLDSQRHYSRIPNLPWQSPWNHTVSSWSVMSELSMT